MKRKKPTDWADKIDKEGLDYLSGLHVAKQVAKKVDDPDKARKIITKALPKLFPGFAQGRTTVITAELLEKMKQIGMPPFKGLQPGEHKLPENTARLFENFEMIDSLINDSELMKGLPIVGAFTLMFLQDVYSQIGLHKYGTKDLTVDQAFWTAGATLEWLGNMLQERKAIPLYSDKGRADVERLELIRTIRAHQKRKLSPKEMRKALEHAGYYVPDEEALRLFEWRAKKKGQL